MLSSENKKSFKLPRIRLDAYMHPDDYQAPGELGFMRHSRASENPCAHCPGHCCHLLLGLTVHDVARICVGLDVQPDLFCRLQPRDDDWNGEAIDIDGEAHFLLLNSGGMQPDGSSQACVFLHDLGAAQRCSIYELRPMTCRLYPFSWWQGKAFSGPQKIWCPEGWLVGEQKKRSVVKNIKQSLREDNASRALIRAFNQQGAIAHTRKNFFHYAIEKGAEALGLDAAKVLAPPKTRALGQRLW